MREDIEIRPLSKRQDCEDYVKIWILAPIFRQVVHNSIFLNNLC